MSISPTIAFAETALSSIESPTPALNDLTSSLPPGGISIFLTLLTLNSSVSPELSNISIELIAVTTAAVITRFAPVVTGVPT